MTFNTARNILAIRFYGTEEGKEINKILNEVEEKTWHTGIPTEEGLYWVYAPQGRRKYTSDCFVDGNFIENGLHVAAWQKLTPYEEKEK